MSPAILLHLASVSLVSRLAARRFFYLVCARPVAETEKWRLDYRDIAAFVGEIDGGDGPPRAPQRLDDLNRHVAC